VLVTTCTLPVFGCLTVPGTGRKQLILIPIQQETSLGVQAYREILAKERISDDERMTAILRRVGLRIADVAQRPDFEWEFTLIESDQLNAFCLPGGKIAVYTGILPMMRNEAGMAIVLGHEVAHAIARHGGERLTQRLGVSVAEQIVAKGLKNTSPEVQRRTLGAFGLGANLGVLLPYSRLHELEADELGLAYAARAGYDPREAVDFWKRMQAASERKMPEFLSTHPHPDRRIEDLATQMPAVLKEYEAAAEQFGAGEAF
jgi:predicted Zn-dependent protease